MTRFLLALAGFVVLIYLLRRLAGTGVERAPRGAKRSAPSRATEMVRDRVCNTFLPRDRAIHALVNGHEEHFCSVACRDRALQLQPAH